MRIRPGRVRSLMAGIAILIVTIAGLLLMPGPTFGDGFPGVGPGIGLFRILWLVVGLVAAGMAFYNAFSGKGLPLYEIEVEREQRTNGDQGTGAPSEKHAYCPNCGNEVGSEDRFCRHCGRQL